MDVSNSKRHRLSARIPSIVQSACLAFSTAACFALQNALAQVAPPPAATPSLTPVLRPVALPVPVAAPGLPTSQKGNMVKLKFENCPLDGLLAFYSDLTGRTILRSPELNATTTLRTADNVSPLEAADLIEGYLVMCGVALVKDGDKAVRAVPLTSAHREALTIADYDKALPSENARGFLSRRITLRYLDPSHAVAILTPLMNQSGVVQAIEAQNALLVTDTAPNLRRMKTLLDETEQQVARNQELHVIELKHRSPSIIKKQLDAFLAGGGPTAPRTATQLSSTPGVIRPRSTVASQTDAAQASGQSPIRGRLLILADDATGVLVMTTEQENLAVLDKLIGILDRPLKKIEESEGQDASSAVKEPPARSVTAQTGTAAP